MRAINGILSGCVCDTIMPFKFFRGIFLFSISCIFVRKDVFEKKKRVKD